MKLLDLSLPTPAENLACDEALLAACEAQGGTVLRFWESTVPFVVVGYGNSVATEVNLPACTTAQMPVLRRCSGGGTVMQGPGCLNFAVVLDLAIAPELATVSGANRFILCRQAAALSGLLGEPVELRGDTDLVWRGRKFSGNAQRRRRTHLLFHGTILLGLELSLVTTFLAMPTLQPAYRQQRPHREFIGNLPLSSVDVKRSLQTAWQADELLTVWPEEETRRLVRERYACPEWIRRR